MNFVYTARRSLITGHTAGVQYALSLSTTATTRSREVRKTDQRSLSGQKETLYFRGSRRWRVVFAPVRGNDLKAMIEFLDSTESGDVFTATLDGDALTPVNVTRADSGYTLNEFMAVGGAPLTNDWFTADIDVEEA
jgi:hypothetical protein